MFKRDRAKDTARSVGSFQDMMGALGRAAGWSRRDDGKIATQHSKHFMKREEFAPGRGHINSPYLDTGIEGLDTSIKGLKE